jgi:acyl-CoA thioester hydrolase
MNNFIRAVELRWSDLDPNFHLRHSIYYDYGAYCRIEYLKQHGITAQLMRQHNFGPIIFREECIFKKEIRPDDKITLDLTLVKANHDYSRWTMQHNIFKNNEIVAAIITLDGAWIDVVQRKLTVPPQEVFKGFEVMPRAPHFEWIEKA